MWENVEFILEIFWMEKWEKGEEGATPKVNRGVESFSLLIFIALSPHVLLPFHLKGKCLFCGIEGKSN